MNTQVTGTSSVIHSQRVRLKLPFIHKKRKISSKRQIGSDLDTSVEAQNEFLAQLNARSTPLGKLKLNPLKVLVPYKKKLTSLEAQRIIGVLDELKLKCEVILVIPNIIRELPKHEQLLGEELTNLLRHHSTIIDELHALEKVFLEVNSMDPKKARAASDPKKTDHSDISATSAKSRHTAHEFLNSKLPSTSTDKGKIQDTATRLLVPFRSRSRSASDSYSSYHTTLESYTQDEREQVVIALNKTKMDLQFSVKNVLRAFGKNGKLMQQFLTTVGRRKYKEAAYFLQCLSELKDLLMERLLVAPVEQREKMQFLAQIAAQDKNNLLVIKQLEDELEAAHKDRDAEILNRNETIKSLQSNLETLEKATDDDIRRAKTESEKQAISENRASSVRQQKLNADLKELSLNLSSNIEDHRDGEQQLRKKKWKLESEIESWIQKYDDEMTQKQDEYEKIDAIYQEEKKQLVELEERFKVIDAEYQEIMKRKREAQSNRESRMQRLQRQVLAVVAIQALWRSFRVRKLLRTKQVAKGKKKKGKKKKK